MSLNTTLVTGIWDLGRSNLEEGWARSFDHYISNFRKLLTDLKDIPFVIFIDPSLEDMVWECRDKANTVVHYHTKGEFNNNFFPFFDKVQEIRLNSDWFTQAGWLKDSAQASMEYYNPMVMSKMFLLNNARIFNSFNTDYLFWIDGGLTNTVHPGYFSHDLVLEKIEKIVSKFLFICFPYETTVEIHGFPIGQMQKFCQSDSVNRVARGGFFGGKKEYIGKANDVYYNLLNSSLNQNLMGTEECIFTMMTYLDPDTYNFEMINENGLISTFFENIKNEETEIQKKQKLRKYTNNNVILYINAFNSPEQLTMVLESFEKYDNNFLNKTRKILINNTTKDSLFESYDKIAQQYDLEDIRQGNLGVCRARQYAAEHFEKSQSKYMLFFEDDMLLDLSNTRCQFGFNKHIDNLYANIIDIMNYDPIDFLKLSFSEFYGHNGEQWSWHNVPAHQKIEYFGNIKQRPLTKFNNIKNRNRIPYCDGEIYYSNWPHIINQEGNTKLFLDTKWQSPFEQTWMSHIYTLTRNKLVNPAILLASPITHNRIHFYEASERKEN